jgi:hypothetical protein
MERLIIDRFENGFAICEKQIVEMIDIKTDELPSDAKEGDCLVFDGETYRVDESATQDRRKIIQKKMDELFVD